MGRNTFWTLFNWPFITNMIIFGVAIGYTLYLDRTYTYRKQPVPKTYKQIFLLFAVILITLYLVQFSIILTQIASGSLHDKYKLIDWVIEMFLGNILVFGLTYFGVSLMYPDQFLDTHKPKHVETSLLDSLIEMIHFSSSTFFTIGFGDVITMKNMARILNMMQIGTAYVVQTYIYVDIFLGQN